MKPRTDCVESAPALTEPAVGSYRVNGHHGEILQGVFEYGGRLRRGLVTLPCSRHHSRATFMCGGEKGISVRPAWRTKAQHAVELTLERLGWPVPGGVLDLTNDTPLCRGFGSSTADVTAAIGAVTAATGHQLSRIDMARLAVAAESASDCLVFDRRAVLFAHREGELLEDFGADLMPLAVLGFGTSEHGTGVETLSMRPARYSSWEIEAFRPLVGLLRRAVLDGDVGLLGRVATASTRINQRHLAVPRLDRLLATGATAGAAGMQVAHSGDVAGFLFDPADPATEDRMAHAADRLRRLGIVATWQFETER